MAKIIPAVNQVELHPYLPQTDLVDFSTKHGILIMAHQPLGGRPVPMVRAHPDEPFPTENPTVCPDSRETTPEVKMALTKFY